MMLPPSYKQHADSKGYQRTTKRADLDLDDCAHDHLSRTSAICCWVYPRAVHAGLLHINIVNAQGEKIPGGNK